eukprot:gene3192-3716_t
MKLTVSLAITTAVVTAAPAVVDLGWKTPGVPIQEQIAAQVCVGLTNRRDGATGPGAYPAYGGRDLDWLKDIDGIVDPPTVVAADFIHKCIHGPGAVAVGYIRYNFTLQQPEFPRTQLAVPNLITLAAVLDAPLLEDGHPAAANASMIFNAVSEWGNISAHDATLWVYSRYANSTTALAKMNPGLNTHTNDPVHPPLTGKPNPGLVDFIVKERLFNFFLNLGCIPGTQDHSLMETMAQDGPWPKPIAVYGYDDTFGGIGGDPYEAETDCVEAHNMGQIASDGLSTAPLACGPALSIPPPPTPIPKRDVLLVNKAPGDYPDGAKPST